MKDKKRKKDKEKTLSLGRTWENNIFALGVIARSAPAYLILYLLSSAAYSLLGFFSDSFLLRAIVNDVEAGTPAEKIFSYIIFLGLLNVAVMIPYNWFWNVMTPKYNRRMAGKIEKMLFRKAAEVDLACYETPTFFDKYVRAVSQTFDRVLKVMFSLDDLIGRLISLFANSFLLFLIDPVLILFGLFPLLLGFLRRKVNALSHDHSVEGEKNDRRADYTRRTFYLSDYAKEMRVGHMKVQMLKHYQSCFADRKRIIKKYGYKQAVLYYAQTVGLEVITVLGAMLYAVWRAVGVGEANGGMGIGDCIVVLNSIATVSYCLNSLVQNVADFGEHALVMEDVRYFLDYEVKITEREDGIEAEAGDIAFSHVSFRYEGAEEDALKDVSLTLKKGERIALVGHNGSGKSTLVKLLLRLYDPAEGQITLNGRDVKDCRLSSYRDAFSTVFQDFKLFSLTVRENVLRRPYREGDEELVIRALKESGAYEKVASLKHGIETILTREFDDEGANLSVGEQQKVALARIFVEDTPFVVLDEPSSALDPIAEYRMFENMMRATEGRSVVFISHRLSSAVLADRVYLMEQGRVVEQGTHKELMAQNGRYADMFRRQAENYLGEEVMANV